VKRIRDLRGTEGDQKKKKPEIEGKGTTSQKRSETERLLETRLGLLGERKKKKEEKKTKKKTGVRKLSHLQGGGGVFQL